MHPKSPPLTIGGTVLKESDDVVILGVTFDSKMTFEKHLCYIIMVDIPYFLLNCSYTLSFSLVVT